MMMMMTYFRNHLGASECLKKVKDEEAWNFKVIMKMMMTTMMMMMMKITNLFTYHHLNVDIS